MLRRSVTVIKLNISFNDVKKYKYDLILARISAAKYKSSGLHRQPDVWIPLMCVAINKTLANIYLITPRI